MAFTFSGHGTFPEQIRELREPRDFHKAFNVLYALAVPFYAACAVLAFWAFGNMNSSNNTENLSDNTWQRVAMYIGLVTGFPGVVLGQVVLMLKIELPLGVLPCDWWSSSSQMHAGSPIAQLAQRIPPVLFRLIFRTLYLGSMLLFAEMLAGAGLAIYVNLAGALGLSAMTFWLPYVLWLVHRRQSAGSSALMMQPCRVAMYIINAIVGLFITATGVYFNVSNLLKEDLALFHEKTCKSGAHYWGTQGMWETNLSKVDVDAVQQLVIGCCVNGSTCGI